MASDMKSASRLSLVMVIAFLGLGLAGGYGLAKLNQRSAATLPAATNLGAKPTTEGGVQFANKVIKGVTENVEGKISQVKDKEITLEESGDTLTFTLMDGSRITRMKLPTPPTAEEATKSANAPMTPPVPEEISLSDLKVGDRVVAMVSVTPGGLVAFNLNVMVQE